MAVKCSRKQSTLAAELLKFPPKHTARPQVSQQQSTRTKTEQRREWRQADPAQTRSKADLCCPALKHRGWDLTACKSVETTGQQARTIISRCQSKLFYKIEYVWKGTDSGAEQSSLFFNRLSTSSPADGRTPRPHLVIHWFIYRRRRSCDQCLLYVSP